MADRDELLQAIDAEVKKYGMKLTMEVSMLTALPAPDEQTVLRCSEDLAAICKAAFADDEITTPNKTIRGDICGDVEQETAKT